AERELPFWQAITASPAPALGARQADDPRSRQAEGLHSRRSLVTSLPAEVTGALLTGVPAAFHGRVNDVLLAGLAAAVAWWRGASFAGTTPYGSASFAGTTPYGNGWAGGSAVLVDVEGHGREEDVVPGADLSRTVGWFTSMYPVRLDAGAVDWDQLCAGGPDAGLAVKRVKEQLRAIPGHGIGFGLLRYLNPRTRPVLAGAAPAQLGFNYLGRFGSAGALGAGWEPVPDAAALGGGSALAHPVEVDAVAMESAAGPVLHATWSWDSSLLSEDQVASLAGAWLAALRGIAAHVGGGGGGWTPSDVPLVRVSQEELDELEADL
ncbi:MAG TPA: condensation domain-containing protein, partial [Streptosporangiaceae bacterium]